MTSVSRGARLFGYSHLYGGVPGGQAEYLRVPMAHYGPLPVPDGVEDDMAVLLADALPTAWQAVEHAGPVEDAAVCVFGLGPIGQMASRTALHRGARRVIGVDWVPERLAMAGRHAVDTVDPHAVDDPRDAVLTATEGRGADAAIDAVGAEAESGAVGRALQTMKLRPDRLTALRQAYGSVRRGGTLSVSGVYGGVIPLVDIGEIFDRQVTVRMGQANVRRWTGDIVLLLDGADPLGLRDLVTHTPRLDEAPAAYEMFRDKGDGAVKVVLHP